MHFSFFNGCAKNGSLQEDGHSGGGHEAPSAPSLTRRSEASGTFAYVLERTSPFMAIACALDRQNSLRPTVFRSCVFSAATARPVGDPFPSRGPTRTVSCAHACLCSLRCNRLHVPLFY